MEAWTKVKWSEARHVAEAMGLDEHQLPEDGVAPAAWYERTVADGDFERAASIIGHALPRYEAVAWAARLLESHSHRTKLLPRDQQALDRSLRWLDEPTEEFRREAYEASEQASEGSAERMLATALFLSGGSIAPSDLEPVSPPPELSGRFAATAVILAAHREDDPAAVLREALAAGEKIAARGLAVGAPS